MWKLFGKVVEYCVSHVGQIKNVWNAGRAHVRSFISNFGARSAAKKEIKKIQESVALQTDPKALAHEQGRLLQAVDDLKNLRAKPQEAYQNAMKTAEDAKKSLNKLERQREKLIELQKVHGPDYAAIHPKTQTKGPTIAERLLAKENEIAQFKNAKRFKPPLTTGQKFVKGLKVVGTVGVAALAMGAVNRSRGNANTPEQPSGPLAVVALNSAPLAPGQTTQNVDPTPTAKPDVAAADLAKDLAKNAAFAGMGAPVVQQRVENFQKDTVALNESTRQAGNEPNSVWNEMTKAFAYANGIDPNAADARAQIDAIKNSGDVNIRAAAWQRTFAVMNTREDTKNLYEAHVVPAFAGSSKGAVKPAGSSAGFNQGDATSTAGRVDPAASASSPSSSSPAPAADLVVAPKPAASAVTAAPAASTPG